MTSKTPSKATPFWKKNKDAKPSDLSVVVGDGKAIQMASHGWGTGHVMLEGICANCNVDDDCCECGKFTCMTCGGHERNLRNGTRHRCL